MRDGDRHQDEKRRAALAVERHAGPADEAERGQDDDNHHQDDRDGSPDRAQQDYGEEQHRSQHDGSEDGHFPVDRVAHGAVEDEFAGNMVFDCRVFLPRCRGGRVEEVGNLQLGPLPVLVGKRDADNQPGDAAVAGNEATGDLLGPERDFPDPFQVRVGQRTGVVDQRIDDQLVLASLAMGIVGDGIDARDVGRSPEPIGQLLDRGERFPRENGPVPRRDRDKRGIGESIGVFQPFQRDDMRVVLGEMIPDVDVDFDDAPGAGGKRQHEDHGKQDGQPSATHDERYALIQIHIVTPAGGEESTISPAH